MTRSFPDAATSPSPAKVPLTQNPLLRNGKHKSLTSAVYELIKEDILSGQCPPGSKLLLVPLSERYQVSNAAVREALSRLSADRLVDVADQRGFQVAPVSAADLLDITRVRTQIETEALRLSIEHGDTEWETQMLASLHRLRSTQPLDRNRDVNASQRRAELHRQFHHALLAGCDSPWLLRLQALLYQQTERYRRLSSRYAELSEKDYAQHINDEHEELVALCIRRDAPAAVALLSHHIAATAQRIIHAEAQHQHSLLSDV